jgi:hypothetical protein
VHVSRHRANITAAAPRSLIALAIASVAVIRGARAIASRCPGRPSAIRSRAAVSSRPAKSSGLRGPSTATAHPDREVLTGASNREPTGADAVPSSASRTLTIGTCGDRTPALDVAPA